MALLLQFLFMNDGFLLLFSNLLVELRIGLPLPLDDQEEDAGGNAEDDGEHGDHGGEDHVVKHRGGGSAVAPHLRHDWRKSEHLKISFASIVPHLSLSWLHTEVEVCHTGVRYI